MNPDILGRRIWDGWVGGEIVGVRIDPPMMLVAWDTGSASWTPAETIQQEGPHAITGTTDSCAQRACAH